MRALRGARGSLLFATGTTLFPSHADYFAEFTRILIAVDIAVAAGGAPRLRGVDVVGQALLGLLVYCYATGGFSSPKLERATYNSVAVRFIAANDHPDPHAYRIDLSGDSITSSDRGAARR